MLIADIRPRIADCLSSTIEAEGSRITLGLVDMGRDAFVPALCFYDCDTTCSDEKCVVSWSALCRPLSDRQIAAFSRTCSGAVSKCLCIDFPTSGAELFVNKCARGSLVNIDFSGSGLCFCRNICTDLCRRLDCCCLKALQLGCERRFRLFRFSGDLFPYCSVLTLLAGALLRS